MDLKKERKNNLRLMSYYVEQTKIAVLKGDVITARWLSMFVVERYHLHLLWLPVKQNEVS